MEIFIKVKCERKVKNGEVSAGRRDCRRRLTGIHQSPT